MIQLTEKEVQDIINFINDIPTKFGGPLISFLENKKQNIKAQEDFDNIKETKQNNK